MNVIAVINGPASGIVVGMCCHINTGLDMEYDVDGIRMEENGNVKGIKFIHQMINWNK